jgi:outer membrane protein OmpA-like peptidoglycan-associated protein
MTFSQPGDVATQVARAIASGDIAQAAKLAASGDPTQEKAAAAVLEQITKGMGFKIGPEDKIMVLGQAGEATRISIPLIKPGETNPTLSMQLDVVRDQQTGWRVSQFRLPKELEGAVADVLARMNAATASASPTNTTPTGTTAPTPSPSGAPMKAAATSSSVAGETIARGVPLFTIDKNPDPLGVAHVFVQALLNQDYSTACSFVDAEKVPNQKLAGLCIVFEEGEYHLKAGKPLVMTIASDSEAWVIAQVRSEKLQQATEFGLEMQRAENKQWRIVGLNLSDLLGSFAKSTGKLGGVPYTPLVKNPGGGESLALYFEYDQAELHPRAAKQLEIVANMLKANSTRKLRITGHTDAKGTDGYNLNLSTKRALSVKLKLAALGVSPDQVVTEGVGKAAPLGPNQKADGTDDPEGRSRNRRAEIFLDF